MGVDLVFRDDIEMPPVQSGQSLEGGFSMPFFHYLTNINMNVSNATMNIPNAMRSLKSKLFLSIRTTPIL